MEIKGFVKTSLIDWDGKITSVIFLPNCNFRCPMCHNYGLVLSPERYATLDFSDIERYIVENSDFLDGVVITGGEPTLHRDIDELCMKLKNLGMKVKLDTNGYYPDKIKELIDRNLVDYIAMDVKSPLDKEKYSAAAGVDIDIEPIKESIELVKESGIDYEFRTTVVPSLHTREDVLNIAKSLSPAKKYVLQQFVPENAFDEGLRSVKPYGREFFEDLARECKKFIKEVIVRA